MERLDLETWLNENRSVFLTFTMEEIAARALVSGYSKEEVENWITETKWDRRVA